MNKMIYIFVVSALLITYISGCLNLDPFLFNAKEITEYELDNYRGKQECNDAVTYLNSNKYPVPFTREISVPSGKETIYGIICTEDSVPISANDTVILYFHGNAAHIDYYWQRARLLFATGYATIIIDYRGYGKSTGESTERGIYEDGRVFLDYIRDSLNNPSVITYAFSLGTLVGTEVTSTDVHNQIIQFILEAPIGSIETLTQDAAYLNIPGTYVSTYKGNNAEKIKKINIPFLWIHGTEDETLIRETNGLHIWNNYPGQTAYYIKVQKGAHGNVPKILTYATYIKCLKDFIQDAPVKDPNLVKK
jgi:hypothetical protein